MIICEVTVHFLVIVQNSVFVCFLKFHIKQHRLMIAIEMQCIYYIKVWSLFTKLDLGDLINEDEKDWTCSTYGGEEKCTQGISRET